MPQPLENFDGKVAQQVASGMNHTLVLTVDGKVYGFGLNSEG